MAKKQGISYSPNTALIQGAAAAYKNYDNVAGMYAGLEQATQAGVDTFKSVMDEKAKQADEIIRVNKLFDDAADQVLLNSGALGQTLYDSTYDELVKAKKVYLDGVNEKDDKKRIEGLKYIQNHSTWVQSHKAYITELATDKVQNNLSSYMSETDKEIQALIMKGDYKKTSRDEKTDEVVFHVNLKSGEQVKITDSQFKEMAAYRDFKFSNSYVDVSNKVLSSEDFNANLIGQTIIENMPNTKKGMGIIMSDGILGEQGDQRNLKTMLEKSMVDGTLESEILSAIGFDISKFDKEKDGLSDIEKANFIDAVVNTENPLFDVKTSQSIMKEQLILAAKNKHQKYWEEKNKKEQERLNKIYGITPNQGEGNYLVGRQGNLFNPATGQEEYVGYNKNKAGNILYDDRAIATSIQTGKEFEDAFGNIYKPVVREGKVVGYNITDGVTGKFLKTIVDEKPTETNLMVTKQVAYRNAVGQGTLTGGNKKYD
tara:strand:- start:1965 stop:3419 length:1455 start_codon:yes stop_codon:yes gene_type:complete